MSTTNNQTISGLEQVQKLPIKNQKLAAKSKQMALNNYSTNQPSLNLTAADLGAKMSGQPYRITRGQFKPAS